MGKKGKPMPAEAHRVPKLVRHGGSMTLPLLGGVGLLLAAVLFQLYGAPSSDTIKAATKLRLDALTAEELLNFSRKFGGDASRCTLATGLERECLLDEAKALQVNLALTDVRDADTLDDVLKNLAANAVFRDHFWQKRPILLKGIKAITHVVSVDQVTHMSLKTSNSNWFTKMGDDYKDAVFINKSTNEDVTTDLLEQKLKAKSTFSVNAAGTIFPEIAELCLSAIRAFGLPANANMYATFKGAEVSVPAHNDPQDLLILQMNGEKWWTLHQPQVQWPMTPQCVGRGDDNKTIPAEHLTEPLGPYHLRPGNILYVPFGMIHRTTTASQNRTLCLGEGGILDQGCTSLHLAMGLHMESYGHTYGKLLECALLGGKKLAMDDKLDTIEQLDKVFERELILRQPLPLGFPRKQMTRQMKEQLMKKVLPAAAKHFPNVPLMKLAAHIEDGLERAEEAIGNQHTSLIDKFKQSYKTVLKHGKPRAVGYDWLNNAMGDYQKDTMRVCSAELTPNL